MSCPTETPGFVPISKWPTLTEMADGFSEHLLPQSDKLSGRKFGLVLDDGSHIDHEFTDQDHLTWNIVSGPHTGLGDEVMYKSIEVRTDIFFVDFYKEKYQEQVSIVLDVSSGQALIGVSGFKEVEGGRRTKTTFFNAHVQGSTSSVPYQVTEDLIGKHILYRYSKEDAYEHIYLNSGTFTWHCLGGAENGLADTEPCKMLKLSDELYLLFWTEKIMPVESIVVIDLKAMRSTGRFFCWDPKPKRLVRVLFGSHATLLAETNALAHLN